MQVTPIARILWMLALTACLHACYEPIEGCLDVQATNFEFGADRSVDSLCVYPSIVYTFSPVYGDSLLITSSRYTNRFNQVFSLNTYDFMISTVSLANAAGDVVKSRNTFEVTVGQEGSATLISLPQDIAKVGRLTRVATIANVRETGDYASLSFDVGVPDLLHEVNPVSYDDNDEYLHAFADQFTDDRGMEWLDWIVYYYPTDDVVDTLNITLDKNHLAQNFVLDSLFAKNNGINASFEIEVDFQKWLSGVDFANMDSVEIAAICHENIPLSFSLK